VALAYVSEVLDRKRALVSHIPKARTHCLTIVNGNTVQLIGSFIVEWSRPFRIFENTANGINPLKDAG
jgi:hypothetical protein